MSDTRLLHVRVPVHLLAALDQLKKDRSRSDLVVEAVEYFVERHRLLETLHVGAGSLAANEREAWSSDQRVDQWVKERRAEYESRGHQDS